MAYTKLNRSAATLTKNRTEGSISPFSGMCVTCVDGCIGMCEIGKSAYRGSEVLYPQPFGLLTAASEKDYPVDLSHFSIMGTAVGAQGVQADPDHAGKLRAHVCVQPSADRRVITVAGHDRGLAYAWCHETGAAVPHSQFISGAGGLDRVTHHVGINVQVGPGRVPTVHP